MMGINLNFNFNKQVSIFLFLFSTVSEYDTRKMTLILWNKLYICILGCHSIDISVIQNELEQLLKQQIIFVEKLFLLNSFIKQTTFGGELKIIISLKIFYSIKRL